MRATAPVTGRERSPIPVTNARWLALTWFDRQYRHDIPLPADGDHDGWDIEHERAHGAGWYDERVELLETTLDVIAADGVRLDAVLTILNWAKRALATAEVEGARLRWSRRRAKEIAPIQRHLDAAANQMATLHAATHAAGGPSAALGAVSVQRVRDALAQDYLLRFYPTGRCRRPQTGRPRRPWLPTARRHLKRTGVSRDCCENLLEAVASSDRCW